MSKFTIKISATLNGKTCKNPQVEFIQGAGCIYPCEIKDNEITIETLPGSTDCNCIEGYIKCDDECLNCQPQHFKECFCDTTGDCQDCETCVGGLCKSDCPGKLCIDDTCCDCAETADCPKGFVCNGCGCNCIGTINSEGECVQCQTKGDCKACENCIDGGCVPLECPSNLVCVNGGTCGCPAGTKYDPTTGSCVSIVCNDDRDCGSCESCLSNNCVPITCPAGSKAVINNGTCSCIDWPCIDTTCDNGADCGVGCGCINGECIPCKYLECLGTATCQQALGCECNELEKCQAVGGCGGQYCDGFNKCTEPGCTCYENACVSCENFSCDNDECSDQLGCTCKNGKCDAIGCNNEPCSTNENCGEGCTCQGGLCKDGPCSGSCTDSAGCAGKNCICVDGQCEQSGDGCKDSFTLTKDCGSGEKSCKLIATLSIEKCECDPITMESKGTVNPDGSISFATKAYKNDDKPFIDFKKDINFGDNEYLSGVVDYTIDVYEMKDGKLVRVSTKTSTALPTNTNDFNKVNVDTAAYKANKQYVVVTVAARGMKTVNNNCSKYGEGDLGSYIIDYTSPTAEAKSVAAVKDVKKDKITDKVSSKKPLFIWSRTSAQNFRKFYPTLSGNSYVDIIDSTGDGVIINDAYQVRTDCSGCASPVASHPAVLFCCAEYDYEVSNCRTKLVMAKPDFCEPVKTQTKQYLEITTSGGKEAPIELTAAISREYKDKTITGLRVYYVLKGEEICVENLDLGPDDVLNPTQNVNCNFSDSEVQITISSEEGDLITKVEFDKGNIPTQTSVNGVKEVIVVTDKNSYIAAGQVTAKITFKSGCFKELPLTICEPKITVTGINADQTCTSGASQGSVSASVTGYKSAATNPITWRINTSPEQTVTTNSSTHIFTGIKSGSYVVTATQGTTSLSGGASVVVNEIVTIKIVAGTTSLCGNASTEITVTTEPATAGISLQLRNVAGPVGLPFTTTASGTHIFTGISTSNTYSVVGTKSGTVICQGAPVVITKEIKELNPNIVVGDTCLNTAVSFTIQDNYNTPYIVTGVNGNIVDGKYTPTNPTGPYQIVLSLPAGSCDVLKSGATKAVTVKPSPVIQTATPGCTPNSNLGTVNAVISGATSVYLLTDANVQTNLVNTGGNNWSVTTAPINKNYTLVAKGSNGCETTRPIIIGTCTSCEDATFTLSYTPLCAVGADVVRGIPVSVVEAGIPASGTITWYSTNSTTPIKTGPYTKVPLTGLSLNVSASSNNPANIYAVIAYFNGSETCTITSQTVVVKPSVAIPKLDGEQCLPNTECQCLNNNCEQNPSTLLHYCGCVENAVCIIAGGGECVLGGSIIDGDCGPISCSCEYPFSCQEVTPGNWRCSSENVEPGGCGACGDLDTNTGLCVCNGNVGCAGDWNGCEDDGSGGCKCIF
jgi:hypothetical protein